MTEGEREREGGRRPRERERKEGAGRRADDDKEGIDLTLYDSDATQEEAHNPVRRPLHRTPPTPLPPLFLRSPALSGGGGGEVGGR